MAVTFTAGTPIYSADVPHVIAQSWSIAMGSGDTTILDLTAFSGGSLMAFMSAVSGATLNFRMSNDAAGSAASGNFGTAATGNLGLFYIGNKTTVNSDPFQFSLVPRFLLIVCAGGTATVQLEAKNNVFYDMNR